MNLYELLEVKHKMAMLQHRHGDLGVAWELLDAWLTQRIAAAHKEITEKSEDREA
jgi:hypothetical protein